MEKSTWYNDLNHKHKEELSMVVHKMQVNLSLRELNSKKLITSKVIGNLFNIK